MSFLTFIVVDTYLVLAGDNRRFNPRKGSFPTKSVYISTRGSHVLVCSTTDTDFQVTKRLHTRSHTKKATSLLGHTVQDSSCQDHLCKYQQNMEVCHNHEWFVSNQVVSQSRYYRASIPAKSIDIEIKISTINGWWYTYIPRYVLVGFSTCTMYCLASTYRNS